MSKLRNYQEEDFKNIINSFETNSSVVYQSSTGSGKSVVANHYIDNVLKTKGNKILFITNRMHLLVQMKKRLLKSNLSCGIYNSNNRDVTKEDVTLVTIQTTINKENFNDLVNSGFTHIIVDECHRSVTKSYLDLLYEITKVNKEIKLLGLTATPNRHDGKPLDIIYNDIVRCSQSMQGLIENGYLASYRTFTIPLSDLEQEIEYHSGDFVLGSMSKYMKKDNVMKKTVDQYVTYAKDKKMLVYCVDKTHARDLMKCYNDRGFTKTAYIDGETSENERQKIFSKFEKDEIKIIFSIETITEGLDIPDCEVVQLARPTKSMTLYLQMVGRVLRPKSNGQQAIILDSALNVSRLGMPSQDIYWDLSSNKPKAKKRKDVTVVYKGLDGKISFDQDEDVPLAEMIEVKMGDLISHGEELIKNAEAKNKRLILEYYANLRELIIAILLRSGLKPNQFKIDMPEELNNYNYRSDLKEIKVLLVQTESDIKFTIFTESKTFIVENNKAYYTDSKKDVKIAEKIMSTNLILGNISKVVLEDYKNIIRNIINFSYSPEDIINIMELKAKQNQYKEEQYLRNIEIELKSGNNLYKFDKKFCVDEYNPQIITHNFDCVIEIHNQTQLKYNNEIVFYELGVGNTLQEIYRTKTCKTERLISFMKRYNAQLLSPSNYTKL